MTNAKNQSSYQENMKIFLGSKVFNARVIVLAFASAGLVGLIWHQFLKQPAKKYSFKLINNAPVAAQFNPVKLDKVQPALIRDIQQLMQRSSRSTYLLSDNKRRDFSPHQQSTVIIKDIFHYKKNGTFLEAGALDGELISNTLMLERDYSWTGILVEPDPISYVQMKRKGRKAWLLNACIGTDGEKEQSMIFRMYKTQKWGGRLLNTGTAPLQPGDLSYMDVNMTCFPLAGILLAANLSNLDLLILDLEGAEPMVMRSFPWKSFQINVVMLECFRCVDKDGVLMTNDTNLIHHRNFLKSFMEAQGFYEKIFIPKSDIIYIHKSFNIN